MEKVTNLQIGDWVSHPYDTHIENAIKIDWIRAGEIGFFHHGLHYTVSIDWILPAPLTPEILAKNGWWQDEIDGTYHNTISVYGRKAPFSILDGVVINYVHQLQHALRLCGLDDLANNFQIG